jgi:hypothetical protein
MRVLWIFLAAAAAVAIAVGGLIYDGTRPGEERDLSGLYFLAVALAYEVKRRTGRGRP